jgi:hypothetical protein
MKIPIDQHYESHGQVAAEYHLYPEVQDEGIFPKNQGMESMARFKMLPVSSALNVLSWRAD